MRKNASAKPQPFMATGHCSQSNNHACTQAHRVQMPVVQSTQVTTHIMCS